MSIESNADNLMTNKAFFTPDDLAVVFSISRPTVYKLIERRSIPFHKIGGSIRFSKDDIKGYLDDVRVNPIDKCK